MGIKLYVYPNARPQLHEGILGFEDTVPFSAAGRARHCEVVTDPAQADYFYMGQVADKDAWQLHPNRYPYFQGNEARHVIDLEGDWRDFDHPDWLAEAVITSGHVRLSSKQKFKRRFARPVISPLLVRLAKNPPPYTPPEERGFWFQGQLDVTRKLREKVWQAFELARVPGEWYWVNGWSLYRGENDPLVLDYLAKAQRWSYALCPTGEGPSCRLYEMALLGRIPILIGDYEPFGHDGYDFVVRWPSTHTAQDLALLMGDMIGWSVKPAVATMQYAGRLRAYFTDPTAYLLRWLKER